jgi:hypothetical protein
MSSPRSYLIIQWSPDDQKKIDEGIMDAFVVEVSGNYVGWTAQFDIHYADVSSKLQTMKEAHKVDHVVINMNKEVVL